MPVASRIEEFLRNAPPGRLYVVVGYADVTGLAWLERHAGERPVTLLIGDTRRRLFLGQPQDRRAALEFLARMDVDVLSGYRQGAPLVHQKVFVVASPGGDEAVAGLVGSANLTDAGLYRNEETVVRVAREEVPAVWQQTRGVCARGRRAGERIAGYIRDADEKRPQTSAGAASRRNDTVGGASPRRPAPGGGGGRPPAQRAGGGRGPRRPSRAVFGVVLAGLLLLVGLCSVARDRAGPSTSPAAPSGSPGATSAEPREAQPRTDAAPPPSSPASERSEQPQPGADGSDPRSISPTTVPDGERSIGEPEQGEGTVAATEEAVAAAAADGDGRVGELDDAAVAALSVVVAAATSVFEVEGDFAAASVAALEGMGLVIPATSELAQATGREDVALSFPTSVALTTPWEVSVLAPDPGESGAQAVWAVAVRSPVVCRAVVFDPELGSWAGTTTNTNCAGVHARNSYVQLRGVGGQRGHYLWAPATPDRITVDPADAAADGDGRVGELDDAAVAALSVVVAAATSVFEVEGDFAAASVAALEGMGLVIPATSELAQATGREDVALSFPTSVALTTPWEVSVLAPDPGESGAQAVWAVAVRSPVVCRAVVFDPELGSWAGTTTNTNCAGVHARNSYVQLRGVGGQRGHYLWAPATPDRMTGDEPPADEAS